MAAGAVSGLGLLDFLSPVVVDIHQPLHEGYAEDRGSNLHTLWDVGPIKSLDFSNEALMARLLAKPVPTGAFNAAFIGEESGRIVGLPGFYPDRKVDVAYVEQFTPVTEERLAVAGTKLAATMNRVFP